jgi:hypothetical protein
MDRRAKAIVVVKREVIVIEQRTVDWAKVSPLTEDKLEGGVTLCGAFCR